MLVKTYHIGLIPILKMYVYVIIHILFFVKLQIKTYIHPVTGCKTPYTPMGRFIHVPPPYPRSDWANNFGIPWWKDTTYCIGILSTRARKIRIMNTLTLQEQIIEVCTNLYLFVLSTVIGLR